MQPIGHRLTNTCSPHKLSQILAINIIHKTMLLTRPLSRLLTTASRIPKPTPQTLRLLSTTPALYGKDPKMSSSPPKHEMVYFPKLTSDVRAFGQFRKVLHTGLFSQLVSMEIPVGGDIGDEVHTVDQVLIFTSGEGKATVAGKDQVSTLFTHYPRQCEVDGD